MSNYVKKFNVGNISIDLPYRSHIHTLPLLSFSDFRNSVNIELVFNQKLNKEGIDYFNSGVGFKLNIQKRIIKENNVLKRLIDSNGNSIALNRNKNNYEDDSKPYNNYYTFEDESKRIVRIISGGYEIEYSDFSKEVYNTDGYIISSYDKYGDLYLSYTYNTNNFLTSITYNEKEVLFEYYNTEITSITYDNTITRLIYNNPNMSVNHYSGVNYYMTVKDESYEVRESGLNTSDVFYKLKECQYIDDKMILTARIPGKTIDTITYTFPSIRDDINYKYDYIEITNKKNITQRIQYNYEKPLCSYEIINGDTEFINTQCACNVNLYNTLNNNKFNGVIGLDDGIQMTKEINSNKHTAEVRGNSSSTHKGMYLLTGWMKCPNNSSKTINISNNTVESIYNFYVPGSAYNQWYFFAYQFSLDANFIYVYPTSSDVELKDLRLTYQVTHNIDKNKVIRSLLKENILIDKTTGDILKFGDVEIIYTTEGNETGKVNLTLSDLFRYFSRKKICGWSNELYYNDGKNVISDILWVQVENKETAEIKYISNYDFGYQYYLNGKTYKTIIQECNSTSTPILICNYEDNSIYSYQYINNYLEVRQSTQDGITTYYTRDKGLVTRKKVMDSSTNNNILSNIKYTYDTTSNTILVKDEASNSNSYLRDGITYYMDSIWGVVTKTKINDNIVIEDTYDDDKSTILDKEFKTLTSSGIKHSYGYDKGNLESLICNDLNYNFEYTNEELTKVSKNDTIILEQEHDDFIDTVYYPNKTSSTYEKEYVYDDYDRLIEITDEIENTYDIYPSFDSSGNINVHSSNGSSKLAITEDKMALQKTRYKYNEKGLLKKQEVTSLSSYATKISDETFTYDNVNRLTEKEFTYNNKKIKDEFTYVKDEDDLYTDERIKTSKYYIDDSLIASITNSYDDFKRNNQKTYDINNKTFKKILTIDYNQITKETNLCGSSTLNEINYTYDILDRISLITKNNKSISYEYDNYNRLIRENNKHLDKTIIYEYNDIGNIVSKKIYNYTLDSTPSSSPITISYTYDSTYKDRLTSYNGKSITYNSYGCLVTYDGYSYGWNKGRLKSYSTGDLKTGTRTYQYTYNAKGQRIKKTYSKVKGTDILSQISSGELTSSNKTYTYDSFGRIISEKGT